MGHGCDYDDAVGDAAVEQRDVVPLSIGRRFFSHLTVE